MMDKMQRANIAAVLISAALLCVGWQDQASAQFQMTKREAVISMVNKVLSQGCGNISLKFINQFIDEFHELNDLTDKDPAGSVNFRALHAFSNMLELNKCDMDAIMFTKNKVILVNIADWQKEQAAKANKRAK
jgi:hypothetical protein